MALVNFAVILWILAMSYSNPSHGQTGARPRAYTFVQLVFESSGIAIGSVSSASTAGAPPIVVSVEYSMPPGMPQQLRVAPPTVAESSAPRFSPGERVMLFLQDIRGAEATLFGQDDVGKWPRQRADWRFTIGHVRPLPEVTRIIESLLKVDAAAIDRRAIALDGLMGMGPLGEIAAAQYAADDGRWKTTNSADSVSLSEIRLLMAAKLIPKRSQLDPAANYAMLQLLARGPAAVAIPLLVERLNDPDPAARDTAFSSLRTAALPLTQDTFAYGPNKDPGERSKAQRAWQQWWATQQSAQLKNEVPRMLQNLDAPNPVRRSAADQYLRLVSGQDVGYSAEAAPDRRLAATGRWHAWWRDFSRQLQ